MDVRIQSVGHTVGMAVLMSSVGKITNFGANTPKTRH